MHEFICVKNLYVDTGIQTHAGLFTYIHIYVYMHVCVCLMYVYICVYVCITYIYTDLCMSPTYVCTCIHMKVCIHTYIHMLQGCGLLDNKVFCSCSGHLSSNDRGN